MYMLQLRYVVIFKDDSKFAIKKYQEKTKYWKISTNIDENGM